jgi:hypothetical protein
LLSLRSLEIAQRETNPNPRSASTADLIASVESSSNTICNALRLMPCRSSAVSTTCRVPEPRSRMRSGTPVNSACGIRLRLTNSRAVDAIRTNSSSRNGSVFTSRLREGPSINPKAIFCVSIASTICSVLPLIRVRFTLDIPDGILPEVEAEYTAQWSWKRRGPVARSVLHRVRRLRVQFAREGVLNSASTPEEYFRPP